MDPRYPPVEPFDRGMLDVGDGHRIYWEVCGNPRGKPAVVLHGGPGSGTASWLRRYFHPGGYRLVLFDQRGCGRSTPHASVPDIDLSANTTHHLLDDIEHLRRHLGIARWLVFGGSWGSTLGLAYAQSHPQLVSELVLASVVTTTRQEVDWITRHVGRLFPEAWQRFREAVPEELLDGRLVDAYGRLLHDPDPTVRGAAARAWCDWEQAHVDVDGTRVPDARFDDPRFRLGFARLVTHYWRHAAWLEEGQLLRDARALTGVPGVLVHGRLDVSSPLDVPWQLAQEWTEAELVVVDAGHSAAEPAMAAAIITATDRFLDAT